MRSQEVSANSERLRTNSSIMGIAVSNMANEVNPGLMLPEQLDLLHRLLKQKSLGVEFQFEDLDQLEIPVFQRSKFLGIHQPTQGIDFSQGSNEEHSLLRIQDTMKLSHELQADYLVLHLDTRDNWQELENRGSRIERSKEWFTKLVSMHREEAYNYWLVAEGLEYPKYPSTQWEIRDMANTLRGFREEGAKVGLALDIAHLWRNGSLIGSNAHNDAVNYSSDDWSSGKISFGDYLQATIESVRDVLEVVHITGAARSGGDFMTHLLPGAYYNGGQVDEIDRKYGRDEMDVKIALEIVATEAAKRSRPLLIVSEAHGYPYEQMMGNCENLRRIDG